MPATYQKRRGTSREHSELINGFDASRKALHRATFRGPALFTPVVQAARDLVEQLSLVCWIIYSQPHLSCHMQPALFQLQVAPPIHADAHITLACPARQHNSPFRGRHVGHGTENIPARVAQVQHRYFLLVILTTSTGADLEEFRAALTGAAGELALSVIVVGIGSIDFEPLKA